MASTHMHQFSLTHISPSSCNSWQQKGNIYEETGGYKLDTDDQKLQASMGNQRRHILEEQTDSVTCPSCIE